MREDVRVAVIGLGKIGLPLALTLSENGCKVFGVDISSDVVDGLNSGIPHVDEPGIVEKLTIGLKSDSFSATIDLKLALSKCNFVVVAVPLYVNSDNEPDYSTIDEVTAEIGRNIQEGTTVVFETTLPIGTTRTRFTPILENESGLRVDAGLYIAYSPERISSGTAFRDLARYPKLCGGVSPQSGENAELLYKKGLRFEGRPDLARPNGVWNMGSAEAAEFAKLAETTFRDVNIALANTFASHAQELGVSYSAIQEACNSQPFSLLHTPGISVGGHCIPVYPHLYLQSDPKADLISLARSINKSAPARALDFLQRHDGNLDGKNILISGLSFRTGVKESAFSGALDLYNELEARGARPAVVDELFTKEEVQNHSLSVADSRQEFDALVINSGTREFNVSLLPLLKQKAPVVDGRGVLDRSDYEFLFHIGEA